MNAKRLLLTLVAIAAVAIAPRVGQASPEFLNADGPNLSNFDVVNNSGAPALSFDMIMTNMRCGQIYHYWTNPGNYTPGLGTISMTCTDLGGGKIKVHFTWSGAAVANGGTAHFGLGIEPGPQYPGAAPNVEEMYWDNGSGVQVGATADVVWTNAAETLNGPVRFYITRADSINLPGVRVVGAQWAQTNAQIPLDHLTFNDPIITGLTWTALPALNKILRTNSDVDIDSTGAITVGTDPDSLGTVLLRFQLMDTTGVTLFGSYLHAAAYNRKIPTLTEWGLIILTLLAIAAVVWTVYRRRRPAMVPA